MTTLMTAALPFPAATPVQPLAEPGDTAPSGLTDAGLARIIAAIGATRAESTRAVYGHAWTGWQRWCDTRGIPALPGDPLALCAYLTERAANGRAMATLDLSCTAIRHVHRTCGAADPVASETVRLVRIGLRRTYGSAPRRLARPLGVDDIRRIITRIDRSTPIGIRDAAIILLGYASALRRSELAALTLADVEHKPAGLLLTMRRSKTDQPGHGQVVAAAHGRHAVTDPVAALGSWRAVRGGTPGPLFTRATARSVSLEPMSGTATARMLRTRDSPGRFTVPKPPGSTAPGSPPTRYAPATPPPPPWPESRCTGSLALYDAGTVKSSNFCRVMFSNAYRSDRAISDCRAAL